LIDGLHIRLSGRSPGRRDRSRNSAALLSPRPSLEQGLQLGSYRGQAMLIVAELVAGAEENDRRLIYVIYHLYNIFIYKT
jgi:hypothetical protein